ncbi:MAG: hypothetical protein HFH87_14330 [Lachnospiraceae bacterium]|nr:hypothetical protein [Lachnospiraceae bacterium]
MRKKRSGEKGLLSLEACITLPIFMFLMFFLYSFFVVFEARNEMAHVLLSTADSLSFDANENSGLGESGTVGQIIYGLYGSATNSNSDFTDYRTWYKSTTAEDDQGNQTIDGTFEDIVRIRFIAYLTGGDSRKAEEMLKRYHVKGGVDGLDFSGSRVEDGKLYLSVRYTLEYEFRVFNGGEAQFEQSVCSRLWK